MRFVSQTPAEDPVSTAAQPVPTPEDGTTTERTPTLLEQMGGISGLISSSVPVVVFVAVNTITSLTPAIVAALVAAVAIAVWRLVRREALQPAVSGVLGVAVAAFIAHRTGDARGFFLLGIWTSLVYGGIFAVSILVRRPLVGVVWSLLNGHGWAWRAHRGAVRAYDVATLAWVAVFAARYLVQSELYDRAETGWLAATRLGMGWPLTALALAVTVWAVRRADKVVAAAEPAPAR